MIPWYKRFYQVCEGQCETVFSIEKVAERLQQTFGTPEDKKDGHSHWTGFHPWAVEIFWGGNFTIKRIAISPEAGTRTIGTGTKINGQIVDTGEMRLISFTAAIRLGWYFVFLSVLLFVSLFGAMALISTTLLCSVVILVLRNQAKKDMQEVDIEIYKALKDQANGTI